MNSLACDSEVVHERYPTLFKGLGTLGDEYTIKLNDDVMPYLLCTPETWQSH